MEQKGFLDVWLGGEKKFKAVIKHVIRCIKWSKQRITRGYAECDRWDMCGCLQALIPAMLQDLKENRQGSPSYLGEN